MSDRCHLNNWKEWDKTYEKAFFLHTLHRTDLLYALCSYRLRHPGHYVFKEMSYSGMKISAEEAELDPEENYIDLNADGTAVMCINGDAENMLWEDGQIWAKDHENDKADFEIDDGELTIEVNNMEMVFEKE